MTIAGFRFVIQSHRVGRYAAADSIAQWFAQGQAAVADTEGSRWHALAATAPTLPTSIAVRELSRTCSTTPTSGRTFRTALGFVPRTDIRQATQFATYRWYPKSSRLTSFGPNSFVQGTWDHTGQLQDWTVRYPFEIELQGAERHLHSPSGQSMERFAGIEFREYENLISGEYELFQVDGRQHLCRDRYAAELLPAGRDRCRFSPTSATRRCRSRSVLSAACCSTKPTSTAISARARADHRTIFDNHIVRSTRELPVHARAVASRDPRLQRASSRIRRWSSLDRTKHLTRRYPSDVPDSSGNRDLRRIHRRLRQRAARVRPALFPSTVPRRPPGASFS